MQVHRGELHDARVTDTGVLDVMKTFLSHSRDVSCRDKGGVRLSSSARQRIAFIERGLLSVLAKKDKKRKEKSSELLNRVALSPRPRRARAREENPILHLVSSASLQIESAVLIAMRTNRALNYDA